jgi:hypothetical protein
VDGQRNLLAKIIDLAAAATLGGAVAFAVLQIAAPTVALSAALSAFAVSCRILRAIAAGSPDFTLPAFEVRDYPQAGEEEDELLLTADMAVIAEASPEADELLLDEVVVAIEADQRVVQLFPPPEVLTVHQLRNAIDQHLQSRETKVVADASSELSDAIAELRRSLR